MHADILAQGVLFISQTSALEYIPTLLCDVSHIKELTVKSPWLVETTVYHRKTNAMPIIPAWLSFFWECSVLFLILLDCFIHAIYVICMYQICIRLAYTRPP